MGAITFPQTARTVCPYHEPFNEYLNRIRIQAAQELIRTSDLPIGRIAEEVGFANQSYFGKVFKKQTGSSPQLYRLQVSAQKSPDRF